MAPASLGRFCQYLPCARVSRSGVIEVSGRIQIIRLCCLDNAVDDGTGFWPVDRINHQPVLLTYAERPAAHDRNRSVHEASHT